MLSGDKLPDENEKFVIIVPRNFGGDANDEFQESDPEYHFTLMSNLHCEKKYEVNVYETCKDFRKQETLLRPDTCNLLMKLFGIHDEQNKVTVNCVDVDLGKKHECGPLSIALAQKLLFDNSKITYKLKNVRKKIVESLKVNSMKEFDFIPRIVVKQFLFTCNFKKRV